jgi:two-component system sensor histidine kinase DegS
MSLRRLSNLDIDPSDNQGALAAGPAGPADIIAQTNDEYDQIQKELKEIDILVKQSTLEVEKLAQQNAQLTNKLKAMEANIDTMPRQDIKEVYNAAQKAQMRLFMMRGQVEQLQSRQDNLTRYAASLKKMLDISPMLTQGSGGASRPGQPQEVPMSIIKIIDAQENARRELANQLHDGPAQSLTNLILQAEICERLFDSDPVRARNELVSLKDAVTDTFQKVRGFIFDLRPMMLDDLGLTPTLKKSVEDYEKKTGIACNLTISGHEQRLPPHTEVTVFRVAQELLGNVQRHAQATHIQIILTIDTDKVTMVVEDDGAGFNVSDALGPAHNTKTIGLSSAREQIEMMNGSIDIESSIGKGTRVEFWLPLMEV